MKNLLGIVTGALIAIAIGCAAKSKSPATPQSVAAEPTSMAGGAAPPHGDELRRLDRAITDDMGKLQLARPEPPPLTCNGEGCAQQMSGAAIAATAPAQPTCKPARTATCTDTCTLKDSICKNAASICRIASDLAGTDSYANDTCNRGNASCDAARTRCCSCM